MVVAPVTTTCLYPDGGTLSRPNQVGSLLANIVTGQFLRDGAKAIQGVATGASGGWYWLDCNVCHRRFVACEVCGWVWEAAPALAAGESIECQNCHHTLV
jgi:hypothetical protein